MSKARRALEAWLSACAIVAVLFLVLVALGGTARLIWGLVLFGWNAVGLAMGPA